MSMPSQTKATEVYYMCYRSVVKINTVRYGPRGYQSGYGSGFVWDRDRRLLVTCYHVIYKALHISATFDDGAGTTYKAKVVFSDRERDVAVLRVVAPKDKLRPTTVSTSAVRVGDKVFVIGSPFEFKNSLSTGVISALGREVYIPGELTDEYEHPTCQIQGAIQIDANINPGNSGGPVLDKFGQLIGMAACIYSPTSRTSTGVGFVIPMNTINEFINEALLRFDKDKGTNLGIDRPQDIPNSMNGVCTMVSGGIEMMNTRPNLGIKSPPYQSVKQGSGDIPNSANGICDVKSEHHGNFHHNHSYEDIVGYILREVSEFEGLMIFWTLRKRGKAEMPNGDVLVCRGICKKCDKMEVDILSCDHVEKFGLDHTHSTISMFSNKWKEMRSAICDKYSQQRERERNEMKLTIRDEYPQQKERLIQRTAHNGQWKIDSNKVLSYQSGPISRKKSAPYCSVDQLHTVHDTIGTLERHREVKSPIFGNKFARNRFLNKLDASPFPGLYVPSPTNGLSQKASRNFLDRVDEISIMQGSLEERLRSWICCCPPTLSREAVSCTKVGANKSSIQVIVTLNDVDDECSEQKTYGK